MYAIEEFVNLVDIILNSKRKRHMVGGVLISLSVLFGGLAITTLTLKMEEERNEFDIE